MALTRRTCLAGLLAAPALLQATRAAAAAVVEIAGAEALQDSLRGAAPGTTLRLAPGDYGMLALRGGGGAPGAPLRLVAADPARPPRIAGMNLRDTRHLTLEGLHFDYAFAPGDKLHVRPFQITGCRDIAIEGSRFDGDLARGVSAVDDGHGFGFGLSLRETEGFRLTGTRFADFFNGLHVNRCADVAVLGNEVRAMRMDGMKFTQVAGLRIEGNHIHDFNRSLGSEDHADMIQFFTAGTEAPSRDVVIRGNLLASGQGAWTQSIFIRNERVDKGEAGREMFYRNILIEENIIANAHVHGIAVGETDGLVIRRNAVLRNPLSEGKRVNPRLWDPAIRVSEASRDVTIVRNLSGGILGNTNLPGWQVADNITVQDRARAQPGYFADLFEGDPADPATLRYRPGGPLDGAGIGPARMQG